MSRLAIPEACEEQMRRLALESYPHECCGFLIGSEMEGIRRLEQVEAALNENSTSPRNRFLITPEALRVLERRLKGTGRILLGFFHSHPDHPARPSQFDREHAWPWYSYVIVNVTPRATGALKSWRLEDDRSGYWEEKVVTGEPAG